MNPPVMVTVTLTFKIHPDLVDMNLSESQLIEAITDALEDRYTGVADGDSVLIDDLQINPF